MPQDPNVPNAPQGESTKPQTPAGGVDLGKILLPKKDPGPSKDSAQRVNAGVLLESEQGAVLPHVPMPPAPPAPPVPKKEKLKVQPIETYQGDIENLVQSKNVSVLSIAAAEAVRRGNQPQAEENVQKSTIDYGALARRAAMVVSGVVLLAAAAGIIIWVLQPPRAVVVETADAAPFIKVDETKVLTVPPGPIEHKSFVTALAGHRDQVALSLGLIQQLKLGAASTTPEGQQVIPLTAAELLTYLSPTIPDTLLRAIEPEKYLLGIHSYSGNQPFLILGADSYEAAYAGMLSWERTMRADLLPLFTYTPPVQIQEVPVTPVATSTATTTPVGTATSTATSTAISTPPAGVPRVQTTFVDTILENHDVRAIKNDAGDIVLLWTFINRKVFVITTNEATLRELISRLENPSIVPTP